MSSQPFTLTGSNGQAILGNTHLPEGTPRGVFILCHGFKGYKDYGFVPWLAQQMTRHGFIAHRFNFSHSGVTNNYETFERPDLFEQDTWGKQIFDLQVVAQAVRDGEIPGGDLPMIWFGHSRGGITVTLTAARTFAERRDLAPAGVIAAAAPDRANMFDEATCRRLREQGWIESASTRTRQMLRVGRAWLDEIEADPHAFDPLRAAAAIPCPMLIVHGDQDATVPVEAAYRYAAAAGTRAALKIIERGNHVFNGRNPLPQDTEPPRQMQELARVCATFALACV